MSKVEGVLSNACVISDELRNQLKDSEASYLYTDPDELVKVDEAIAQGVALKVSSFFTFFYLDGAFFKVGKAIEKSSDLTLESCTKENRVRFEAKMHVERLICEQNVTSMTVLTNVVR